jgi:hypothetical protein
MVEFAFQTISSHQNQRNTLYDRYGIFHKMPHIPQLSTNGQHDMWPVHNQDGLSLSNMSLDFVHPIFPALDPRGETQK